MLFLLILAGDIEKNPGPLDTCPCETIVKPKPPIVKCSKCNQKWHISCVGLEGITNGALEKIKAWQCALCIELPTSIRDKLSEALIGHSAKQLTNVIENIKDMEKNIMEKITEKEINIIDKIEEKERGIIVKIEENENNIKEKIEEKEGNEIDNQDFPHLKAVMNNLQKKVDDTNKKVRYQMRRDQDDPAELEKDKLTRIVLKPKAVDIRNSKDLRKKFNEYYPNALLKYARISVGGSYVFQFDDEDAAIQVTNQWNKAHFEGNAGIVRIADKNRTGIVKFVYDDLTEEQIVNDIQEKYPGVQYELFKKEEEFTGMIKVTFKDEDQLNMVIANKFGLCGRKYITEIFKHKPRVIICNTCCRFGHVSRLCRSKDKPVCRKCSQEGHESKDCSADPAEYKCVHCGEHEHATGSYTCRVVKEKLQEIIDRQDGGR